MRLLTCSCAQRAFKINVHETPEEKEYREERQRELLEEHERRAEEGEPPDYEFK